MKKLLVLAVVCASFVAVGCSSPASNTGGTKATTK